MLVRVLGQVVLDGPAGPIPVTGRPASVLAALVHADGAVVMVEQLLDWVWDGEPPATARAQVHKAVAALRQLEAGLVQTAGSGYRLDVDRTETDIRTFRQLQASGDHDSLSAALALWRGPALAGLETRRARAVAIAWQARRLAVVEQRAALLIASGDAQQAAAVLTDDVAANPTSESLVGQLMTALHLSGRTAQALEQFVQLRRALTTQLGVDPSPEITALHTRMLRGDPFEGEGGSAPTSQVPHTIPYRVPDFAGREEDLRRLTAECAADGIVAIDGMPGVGKTTIAIQLAHRAAASYRDGQYYLDLRAHTAGSEPMGSREALGLLLGMAGVPESRHPDGVDARVALWRTTLAGRRVLIVLDNAPDAASVLPLLPGTSGCLALITSRRRLGDLDGARFHSLDVLTDPDAVALLRQVLLAGGSSPENLPEDEVAAVARWCGGLPLAIRLVAGRLAGRTGRTLGDLTTALEDDVRRRELIGEPGTRVHSAFAGSFDQLTPMDRGTLSLLASSPMADFDAAATAALTGTSPRAALGSLERLVDAHLLEAPAPGRYRFHDLVRDFVIGVGRDSIDGSAQRRLHDYYLTAAAQAADLIDPVIRRFEPSIEHPPAVLPALSDRAKALAWFRTEHATLVRLALRDGDWQLPLVLRSYFEHQGHFADWRATSEHAWDCAGQDHTARGLAAMSLGALHGWRADYERAVEVLQQAAQLLPDQPRLLAAIFSNTAMYLHLAGRDSEAVDYAERVLALPEAEPAVTAMGWCNLALATARLGDGSRALDRHAAAIRQAERSDDLGIQCAAHLGLGETLLRLGRSAAEPFIEALTLARAQGSRMQQAIALDGLAHATHEPAHWHAARTIFAELGVPQADLVGQHLDAPDQPHCDLCAGFRATPGPADRVSAPQ